MPCLAQQKIMAECWYWLSQPCHCFDSSMVGIGPCLPEIVQQWWRRWPMLNHRVSFWFIQSGMMTNNCVSVLDFICPIHLSICKSIAISDVFPHSETFGTNGAFVDWS